MSLKIKKFFKMCPFIVKSYEKTIGIIIYCLTIVSVKAASVFVYRNAMGKNPNLEEPQNFNEKLMWLKIYVYNNSQSVKKCADKYRVREYVKQKGCEEILNELYGVWDKVEDICWEELPERFAIKCNHGCGYNILCTDKREFKRSEAKTKLAKWMKEEFWVKYAETNYKGIPKKIICEKYLETKQGLMPNDYKIYYFNGEPKLVLVCSEREERVKLTFFDLNWEQIDIGIDDEKRDIPKPASLGQMIDYGKVLAEGFPFVRIDFYECDGKPIFGEMTFSPAGCVANYYNSKGLMLLGNYLELPKI